MKIWSRMYVCMHVCVCVCVCVCMSTMNNVNYVLLVVSVPKLKDLHNLVTPDYGAHWRNIGSHLGLKDGLLDMIDHDHHHRAEDCCNAVWEQWLDMDTAASWGKVIEATELAISVRRLAKIDSSGDVFVPPEVAAETYRLQKFYRNERYKTSDDDWPSYQPDHFTSLALIHHREKRVTVQEVISIANIMHKGVGSESQLPPTSLYKSTKNISDIFYQSNPNSENRTKDLTNFILIEGAPGIGKTIFSREISFQWANKKLLVEKLLLFLVLLRDPNLHQIKSLEQFVCYVIGAFKVNSTVKAIEQYLEETSGEHCAILLDGYDELPDEVRYNSYSFISQLVYRKILKLCNLVITSRPTVSADLHGIADRRVEILGFTKEDRSAYIQQSLEGNIEDIEKIHEFLELNPFIDSLCYIPLNMTILICLLKSSFGYNAVLPKTQTEINHQFVLITILRYLKRKTNLSIMAKSLHDLPSPHKRQLRKLSQLAFVFLGNEKIVFNDGDIKMDCSSCIGKWDSLGLLKVVKHHSYLGNSSLDSYNFLHFSIQEFLAAFYVASSKVTKQIKLLKEAFWSLKYLNSGIMFCGLTSGNSFAFKHFLSGNKSILFSKLIGAKSIAQNTFSDKVKCLHLFQCFLEAGNDEIALQVGKIVTNNTIDLSGHALLLKDIHTLIFFLARSPNKKWKMLNLSRCYIGDEGLNVLCKTFADHNLDDSVICTINISHNALTTESVHHVVNLIFSLNVTKIHINDNNFDMQVLDDTIFTNCITGKKALEVCVEQDRNFAAGFYFINSSFYESQLKQLIFAEKGKLNTKLYAWNTNLEIGQFIIFLEAISSHVGYVCIYEENLHSCEMANVATKMQLLDIIGSIQFEYVLQCKAKVVAYKANMKKILQSIITTGWMAYYETDVDQGIIAQCNNLHEHLNVLDLYHCQIGDKEFPQLIPCFQKYDSPLYFHTFNISCCLLSVSSVNSLHEILKICVIERLTLSGNSIPSNSLHNVMSTEICIHSKIQNFKYKIPLIVFNDFNDDLSLKNVEPLYLITKYFINCDVDDSVMVAENSGSGLFTYELYLSNVKLEQEIISKILFLCQQPAVITNIFFYDGNSTNITANFQNISPINCKYVLFLDNQLEVHGLKQKKVSELMQFDCTKNMSEIKLKNCKLNFLEGCDFLAAKKWTTVVLSGCSLRDKGFENLYRSFSKHKHHLKLLNLSNNQLTSDSVATLANLLQCYIIEELLVSQNPISHNEFASMMCTLYNSGTEFLNFGHNVSLIISFTDQLMDTQIDVFYIYLRDDLFDLQRLKCLLGNMMPICNILLVDSTLHEVYLTLFYSDTMLKLSITTENEIIMLKDIIVTFISCTNIQVVDISECSVRAVCELLKLLFNSELSLKHLKELRISNNELTSCVDAMITSLHHCIIRRLIIYGTDEADCVSFISFTLGDCFFNFGMLQLILGIPFIILNCNMPSCTAKNSKYSAVILVNNFDGNTHHINKIFTELKDYQITNYDFYFMQNFIMIDDLKNSLSLLYRRWPSNANLTLCEIGIQDKVAEEIVKIMDEAFECNIRYILISQSKLLVYKYYHPFIAEILNDITSLTTVQVTKYALELTNVKEIFDCYSCYWQFIDVSGCKIGDKGVDVLFSCLSFKPYTHHIKVLNISDNCLTLSSVDKIVKFFCVCIVECLLLSDNNISHYLLNKALQMHCSSDNVILNFKYHIPLQLKGSTISVESIYVNCEVGRLENVCFKDNEYTQWQYLYFPTNYNTNIALVLFHTENCMKVDIYNDFADTTIPLDNIWFNLKLENKEVIDICVRCGISDLCSLNLFTSSFNLENPLRHVERLDFSSLGQLPLQYSYIFIRCLQSYVINCIKLSGESHHMSKAFSNAIQEELFSGNTILFNQLSRVPFTLISYTNIGKSKQEIWKEYADIYITNHKANDKFEELLDEKEKQYCLRNVSCKLFFFNLLKSNENEMLYYIFEVLARCSVWCDIQIFEISRNDNLAIKLFQSIKNVSGRIAYVSMTALIGYSTKADEIMEIVAKNTSLDTIVVNNCMLNSHELTTMGYVLCTKMQHLKSVTLSRCFLNNTAFKKFSKYLRNLVLSKLDISHNNLSSSCVSSIITSLKSCVIRKLICDNYIKSDLVNTLFLMAYYREGYILNFITGIPLIVISDVVDKSSTDCTIFLMNTVVNEHILSLMNDISDNKTCDYNLFISKNNCLKDGSIFNHLSFQTLLNNASSFTLIGINLMEDIMIKVVEYLEASQRNVYFLFSENEKLLTNISSYQVLFNIFGISPEQATINTNIGEEFTGIFYKVVSNNVSMLKYIKKVDMSCFRLTRMCIKLIVESLHYCCIQTLTIFNDDLLDKFTDIILTAICAKKQFCNNHSGFPLTVLGNTEVDGHTESWINIYVFDLISSQELLKTLGKVQDIAICGHLQLVFFNFCLVAEGSHAIQNILSQHPLHFFSSVMLYELGLEDQVAVEFVEEIKRMNFKVGYLVTSQSMLLAYRANHESIMKGLNTIKTVQNVVLSECYFADATCKNIWKMLLDKKNALSYLKLLDISHNHITSGTIIMCLRHCIIEKLVVCHNNINDLGTSILSSLCDEKCSILNFIWGIPLIIINSVQEKSSSKNTNSFTAILMNTNINKYVLNLITDVTRYNISHYSLYLLKNNRLVTHFSHALSLFQPLFQSITNFVLYGTDLIDKTLVNIVMHLTVGCTERVEYFLLSGLQLSCRTLTSETQNLAESATSHRSSLCNAQSFNLCYSLLKNETLLYSSNDSEADFSCYQLTLSHITTILGFLNFCCTEKVIVSNTSFLCRLSDAVIDAYFAGQTICNFVSKIPLTITTCTKKQAITYFNDFTVDNIFEEIITNLKLSQSDGTLHGLVTINFLKANQQMICKILSILVVSSCSSIMIYEIGLHDEIAVKIMEQLNKVYKRFHCILVSKTMLLSYKCSGKQISEFLAYDSYLMSHITTVELRECDFSYNEFCFVGFTLSTKFKLVKTLTISKCNFDDMMYKQFSYLIFHSNSPLLYLQKLDISESNVTPSCVNNIITSLQSCIIEKLIISNGKLNNELSNSIFTISHHGECQLRNFVMGIPLTIINIVQRGDQLFNGMNSFTSFLMNASLNQYVVNLHTGVSSYNISKYYLFLLKGNVMQSNLSEILSAFDTLLKEVTYFSLFGFDVLDDIAVKISNILFNSSNSNSEYFIASKTRTLCKICNEQLITDMLSDNPYIIAPYDLYSCNNIVCALPLTGIIKHWELIDISSCNIGHQGLLYLLSYFLQNKIIIDILNISQKNILSASSLVFAKLLLNCQIQLLNCSGNQWTDSIVGLTCRKYYNKSQLKIQCTDSTYLILCNLESDFNDMLSTADDLKHLSMINCKVINKFNDSSADFIMQVQDNKASLSTIHFHDSLILNDIIKINIPLLHINLFIDEKDFVFESQVTDDGKQSVHLTSETSYKFEMQWLLSQRSCTFTRRNTLCSLKYKKLSMLELAKELSQNFKENGKLYYFRIANCFFTDYLANEITVAISENSWLEFKHVELASTVFCGDTLCKILKQLMCSKAIKHILITSINSLSNENTDYLACIISNNKYLEYLNLSNCNLEESTIIKFSEALKMAKLLKHVNLSGNVISDAAASKLAYALVECVDIEHVNLSHTRLKETGFISIAVALKNARLKQFLVNNCCITDKVAKEIVSNLFKKSSALFHLEMSDCDISKDAILCIIEGLSDISSLEYLDLSSNNFPDAASADIALMINKNPEIKVIKLMMHNVVEQTIAVLFSSLENLHSLCCIDLHIGYLQDGDNDEEYSYLISDQDYHLSQLFKSVALNNKQITHITLSNCRHAELFSALNSLSSLQHLDVNSSFIPFTAISSTISNNSALVHINISNCALSEISFIEIARSISSLRLIKLLNISSNIVTDIVADHISATIVNNTGLEYFNMSNCQAQGIGLCKVFQALCYRDLFFLDVSSNNVCYEAARKLLNFFFENDTLQHLNLSFCQMSHSVMSDICWELSKLTSLTYLNLHSWPCKDCPLLGFIIRNNNHLQHLDISGCMLQEDAIITAVQNLTLKHLALSNCNLEEEGLLLISNVLQYITTLKHLDLSQNNISDNAAISLASALSKIRCLEYLNLSNCKLQQEGSIVIINCLAGLAAIECLSLSLNVFTDKAAEDLALIISKKQLKQLALSSCKLEEAGMLHIANSLKQISSLQHLDLSYNTISDEAAVCIASALSSNTSLEYLIMHNCTWPNNELPTLKEMVDFKKFKKLKMVDLSCSLLSYIQYF